MNNLPAVRTENSEAVTDIIQLVSFELDGEEYGIDVLGVREIIRLPAITRMPNTAAYVDGIINLRGAVVPIISLRRRFSLSEVEAGRSSRILVMESGPGNLTGFVVDAVSEVIRIYASEIQPPPTVASSAVAQECITGIVNHGERLLVVLELERLLGNEEQALMTAMV